MKERLLFILPIVLCTTIHSANADWQYRGTYIGDGAYTDDGSRFVLSLRGGASFGMGKIQNDIGALTTGYYLNESSGIVVSDAYYESCVANGGCTSGFVDAGIGSLATLPAKDNFEALSFTAGASLGWTLPNRPQWRIEAAWDHMAESEYNASPIFEGELGLSGGDIAGLTVHAQSGGVESTITTDVISAMITYDFYDGLQKPVGKIIPYLGLGVGYALSKTIMNLSDPYGDLSADVDLRENFGTEGDYGVVQFYRSEYTTSNISGLIVAGLSYGLSDNVFVDLAARIMYVPNAKWVLQNNDETRHRDWFSAQDLIYANFTLGLRFEF
ncbi:MAG: hypothetical protein IJ560_03980 [Alphaproteobacteria bacterium]|nr:hypothetical protein [Alphaproteobacteria bacterium]